MSEEPTERNLGVETLKIFPVGSSLVAKQVSLHRQKSVAEYPRQDNLIPPRFKTGSHNDS